MNDDYQNLNLAPNNLADEDLIVETYFQVDGQQSVWAIEGEANGLQDVINAVNQVQL